jgi:predicted GH43/DUF377 family glycosyl hydrolase
MAVLKKVKKTLKDIKEKKVKRTLIQRVLHKIKRKKVITKPKVKTPRKEALSILKKHNGNPIVGPIRNSIWESEAVFNPGAVVSGGRIHLFYRALGPDGVSRVGYASSKDGIHFDDRLSYPIYFVQNVEEIKNHWPYTSPARPMYSTSFYASGGGWGGCEDPRAVVIDGYVYITLNIFDGTNGWKWDSMRVAVVSIKEEDLLNKKWSWKDFSYLSHLGDRQKNWVLFPEKINGKFVIFHNLDKGDPTRVFISYVNKLDTSETPTVKDAPDPQTLPDHIVAWHKRTRSASAPPIKTKDGWLLLYHAMDKEDGDRYKLGAMLLDLKDPSKVLYRSAYPLLQPDEWYENDWKPGIIYASGAVVKDGTLFIYYGGGDKHIAVASVPLKEFISKLKNKEQAVFTKKSVKVAA